MNRLFSHLRPGSSDETEELSPEELKKQRVQFHRDHVRNGPSNWRTISTGQQRRQMTRDGLAQSRKANRRYRRAWMAKRAELATLRGHLIILGVLECKSGTTFRQSQIQESAVWVIRKYGERDSAGEIVTSDQLLDNAVAAARADFLDRMGVKDRGDGTFVTTRPGATA